MRPANGRFAHNRAGPAGATRRDRAGRSIGTGTRSDNHGKTGPVSRTFGTRWRLDRRSRAWARKDVGAAVWRTGMLRERGVRRRQARAKVALTLRRELPDPDGAKKAWDSSVFEERLAVCLFHARLPPVPPQSYHPIFTCGAASSPAAPLRFASSRWISRTFDPQGDRPAGRRGGTRPRDMPGTP